MLTAVILIGLASWQAVETFRHGSMWSLWRTSAKQPEAGTWYLWNQVLDCPFCLSHWVAAACWLLWLICPSVIYWLAVVRLAQLGNDATHFFNRSPVREEEHPEIEVIDTQEESSL